MSKEPSLTIRPIEAADAATLGSPDGYWLTAETNSADQMLYDWVGLQTPFIVYERVA